MLKILRVPVWLGYKIEFLVRFPIVTVQVHSSGEETQNNIVEIDINQYGATQKVIPAPGKYTGSAMCDAHLSTPLFNAFSCSHDLSSNELSENWLEETKLPMRLINATNEQRLVQEHEIPLRVKGDIEDVSSELFNRA
ncbi:hypothetical protein TNCV_4639931 [Trichonephila clavipes]|nr:hypothetical protein TNCV_4639931 [Trichonephila clavipes]